MSEIVKKIKRNKENRGKEKVLVHIRFDAKLLDDMDKFCKKKSISRAIFIHNATKEYMKLGDKFNPKIDSSTIKGKKEYIAFAVEWYLNEQKS